MTMSTSDALQTIRTLYIDLLKRVLINMIYDDPDQIVTTGGGQRIMARRAWEVGGRAWLTPAHTMIGRKRLENIQVCLESVLNDNIPGDVIETGGMARWINDLHAGDPQSLWGDRQIGVGCGFVRGFTSAGC
jgi:hypothetical protein